MSRRVRAQGRPVVFYPRVWSVVVVSLGCWFLSVLLVDFCFVLVRVGKGRWR